MIKELILIIGFMTVADAVLCQPTTCLSFQCGTTVCPAGFRVKLGGGFCGCCSNCVIALSEGESCTPGIKLGGDPTKQGVTESAPMCDYGLICDENTSKCVKRASNLDSSQDNSQDSSQDKIQDNSQKNRLGDSQNNRQDKNQENQHDNSQKSRQD